MWDNVFAKTNDFNAKLYEINRKIQAFKDATKSGNNPYIAVIKEFYPAVESRFLEDASLFASQFMRLATNNLFTVHSADSLANVWHIYLMRKAFEI